ncbi:MAG TPA: carbon-nitrogen hydrolase family protein [Gemmataceae bacterium]|nr:carbon-nitrogen hydrolase family protein [Gemmataceae bacterium]
MRVAAVQLTSTADKARNQEAAERFINAAAADGARLIVLPEMFNVLGDAEVLQQGAEALDGSTLQWAKERARKHDIWLVAGSIMERVAGQNKLFNTSCIFNPQGELLATYRKIHLFDCDVPGASLHESATMMPGREIVRAEADGIPLGLSICYDLRFPELFRILALGGVRLIVLVSAFTERTGRDHWEILVRARAIENQVFMIAANQVGASTPKLRWFGRSMIVDPWGVVLAQAADSESYILADVDFTAQDHMRAQLPSLANRRPETYR